MGKTAFLLAGAAMLLLAGTAGATVPVAPGPTVASPIELAGCKGTGPFCPFGRHWICPKWHSCWCAPCGAYKLPGGKYRSG
jgi:hypothetical protein